VFGALAHYERALTQERVRAGIAAAQQRGKRGGRPRAIPDAQWATIVTALERGMSKAAVCRTFGIKRATLYDTLARGGTMTRTCSRLRTSERMLENIAMLDWH
jgi:DNA invertase Pin-like site-specific DNA recombinase